MDASQTAAAWLSFTVTVIGLGSLITQASIIIDKLDPFNAIRNENYLGPWVTRQPRSSRWAFVKPPPVGPVITANLRDGFCGHRVIQMSRVPRKAVGEAGWTVLLGVMHLAPIQCTPAITSPGHDVEKALVYEPAYPINCMLAWKDRETTELVRHGSLACISIDRTTLITLLSITNARTIFSHSNAAGYRAAYAGYNGEWYVEWPLGSPATVRLTPMDPIFAGKDVQPPSYERRVDRCVQMTTGVIYSSEFRCAFPGRKPPGRYVLKYIPKGFIGAHGARHLYNIMGGVAYEIDYLLPCKLEPEDEDPQGAMKLILPSREEDADLVMFVPMKEQELLAQAMDLLPWASLSWSIHRGMQDILLAFSKPRMDRRRAELAVFLQQAVHENKEKFEARGWNRDFVHHKMADVAQNAVVSGRGKSADLVRVVTEIVQMKYGLTAEEMDETTFWRKNESELDQQAIVGLTKCFILEWSTDIDYQLYHKLPLKMRFG